MSHRSTTFELKAIVKAKSEKQEDSKALMQTSLLTMHFVRKNSKTGLTLSLEDKLEF